MREQLIQYVELLFAGARDCEEIKQEILQNTLDRYDDLIAEGKVPEAAYRLAITGIGDINEILGTKSHTVPSPITMAELPDEDPQKRKWMRAIAVALYILCPIPLVLLSEFGLDIAGLCLLLALVAVATVLLIITGKKTPEELEEERREKEEEARKSPLIKSISGLIWAVGLAVYFILSFATLAWHITWVIFPILGAVDKLVSTIIENNEAKYSDVRFPSKTKMRKRIGDIIGATTLAVYFILSFSTGAWYITWMIFLIGGAVRGLVNAVLDYKEAIEYET